MVAIELLAYIDAGWIRMKTLRLALVQMRSEKGKIEENHSGHEIDV